MKMRKLSKKIIHVPSFEKGIHTYEGLPLYENDVLDVLGIEIIDEIRLQLAEILELRKKLFGTSQDHFGLAEKQYFFDLQKSIIIEVEHVMAGMEQHKFMIHPEEFYKNKGEDYFIQLGKKMYEDFTQKSKLSLIRSGKSVYARINENKK